VSNTGTGDSAIVFFRRTFVATKTSHTLKIASDNRFTVFVDGVQIGSSNTTGVASTFTSSLAVGATHVIAVRVRNTGGAGGLIIDVR
jgi:hypothetical protein